KIWSTICCVYVAIESTAFTACALSASRRAWFVVSTWTGGAAWPRRPNPLAGAAVESCAPIPSFDGMTAASAQRRARERRRIGGEEGSQFCRPRAPAHAQSTWTGGGALRVEQRGHGQRRRSSEKV